MIIKIDLAILLSVQIAHALQMIAASAIMNYIGMERLFRDEAQAVY